MAENDSNEGQDLALKMKKEFEIEVKKAIVELNEGEATVSQEGLQVIATKGKQYIMSVRGIPVAIISKTERDTYEFKYSISNMQKLEEQLKQNQEQFELLPQLKQIAEIAEKEKQKERESRGEDNRDTLENDVAEKEEEKEEQPEKKQEQPVKDDKAKDVKMDSTAMEIPADKKIGQNYTIATKLQELYPELLEGDEKFFVKPDDNDRYNFRLYARKKGGTVIELPVNTRVEGKNAREEQIMVSSKDGTKIEKKQPLQIMMVNKDFGFAMFGEGDRYKEFVAVTRDQGDDYNGHILCENGETKEWEDGSFDVREGTDDTLGQRANGDDGEPDYNVFIKLEELEKQQVLDKEDVNIDNVERADNAIDITTKGLMEKYGLEEDTAKCVGKLILIDGKGIEEALREGILEEEKDKERKGTIMPGSAETSADDRVNRILNGEDENEEEREEDPRVRGTNY